MVSAQDFRDAFSQQWRADRRRKSAKLRDAYQDDKRWTAYMLGKKDDFLGTFFDRLARRLGQEMLRERQNLDVVYYTTKARNIGHKKRIRPARLNVIIEHENKEKVEEEMWKMLMWRAPLKVLVLYDWPPWRKTTTRRQNWLENKLTTLFDMRREVDTLWPEAAKTTYLFLVGRLPQRGALPVWWYCDSSNRKLRQVIP